MKNKSMLKVVSMLLKINNLLIECIGYILWGARYKKTVLEAQRVCVVKAGNVGDLLCAVPTFNAIRKKFSNAQIELFTHGGDSLDATVILKGFQSIDRIVVFNRSDTKSFSGMEKIARLLRNGNYDYIIYLSGERARLRNIIRDMWMIRKAGRIPVYGFRISTVRALPKIQARYKQFVREAVRQTECLPFDIEGDLDFSFDISDADKIKVDSYLENEGITTRIVLLSMRGKAAVNQWPTENFNQVAQYCTEKYGMNVLAIGGKSEAEWINDTMDAAFVRNVAGKFTIAQSIYMLSKAFVIITVDTGTAHMASLTDTNAVVLSSSYYFPEKWMPYGKNVVVLRTKLPCSPCLKEVCPLGTDECIRGISASEVCDVIDTLIGKESAK